jgi:diguanylate cyclase (GGDEF)-like protein
MTKRANKSSRARGGRQREVSVARVEPIVRLNDEELNELTSTDLRSVAAKSVRMPKWAGLMTLSGPLAGKVYRLTHARTTIGRSRGADILLPEHGVSRHHCTLLQRDGTFTIEDAGSTNGTLVNGERVSSAELVTGDRIQLGPDIVLQLDWFDETEADLANHLVEAARRDVLTGALNRRAFDERFGAELAYATRHGEKLVAIALDIDHFKKVNDTYGHGIGDLVLREVANLIASKLRAEDIFARVGGEEFVVIARGLTSENGARLAERLRSAIEAMSIHEPPHDIRVTISLGVAGLREAGAARDGEALLELADARLYEAKRAGRNRVVRS